MSDVTPEEESGPILNFLDENGDVVLKLEYFNSDVRPLKAGEIVIPASDAPIIQFGNQKMGFEDLAKKLEAQKRRALRGKRNTTTRDKHDVFVNVTLPID